MSYTRLRSRIKRVKSRISHEQIWFLVDPILAKQIRDDDRRLREIWQKELKRPLPAAEEAETSTPRARICENLKAVRCPRGYGLKERRQDDQRLRQMSYIGPRNEAEDKEQALLTTRVLAFDATPEGRARKRIAELSWKWSCKPPITPGEREELAGLEAMYPHVPDVVDRLIKQIAERFKRKP